MAVVIGIVSFSIVWTLGSDRAMSIGAFMVYGGVAAAVAFSQSVAWWTSTHAVAVDRVDEISSDLAEKLRVERYKFVTDRQKYFTDLARDAFANYARVFTALVAGALPLYRPETA